MIKINLIDWIALIVTGVLLPILFYILYDRSEKRGDRKPPRQRTLKKLRDSHWLSKGCFADAVSMCMFFFLGLVVWGGIVCLVIFL